MRLNEFEQRIFDGELGAPRQFALSQQLAVGRYFDAEDFVRISQAHVMADGEAVGDVGVQLLEKFVAAGAQDCKVLVPTVTDPRGVDPLKCRSLRQPSTALDRENRIVNALRAMGLLMTDTCINYQSVAPPLLNEHLAFGDTGSVIYANSVCGARSNFEGGPAALWAAMTGRVPRYGLHLREKRIGTHLFDLQFQPRNLTDWGAIGGIIGRQMGSYWHVPVLNGYCSSASSDEMKHFGAALASYGSTPMFHVVGVTPEAHTLEHAFVPPVPKAYVIDQKAIENFYQSFASDEQVDVVVFAAPQLSLFELRSLARLLEGKNVHQNTELLVATSPEVARACERMGLRKPIEDSGAQLLEGVCFYNMYAREMGQANGWRRLVTNSAKLANIISGYGYVPSLVSMERCVTTAIHGKLS